MTDIREERSPSSVACMDACIEKTGNSDNYVDFVDYGCCTESPSGTHIYDTCQDRPDLYICWYCKEEDSGFWSDPPEEKRVDTLQGIGPEAPYHSISVTYG